jgi:hypothetical protein
MRVCSDIKKAELEALPPEELQSRVRVSILSKLDAEQRGTDLKVEAKIRRSINKQLGVKGTRF